MRYFLLFILLLISACGGQTKEEMSQEGGKLLDAGNYRGAMVLYKNALEKDANFLDARIGLAESYLKSGQFDRAETEYQKVLLQNPTLAETHLNLARVYINKNMPEKALLELDAYHRSNPESVESLVLYGRAHGAAGDLVSAEKALLRAASLNDKAFEPYLYLGRVYSQQEDLPMAEHALRKAIELAPKEVQAYYLLANLLARQGLTDAALQVYLDLIAQSPEELRGYYMATILQMDSGDIPAAEQTLADMAKKFPKQPEVARLKGMLQYRQGDYENAKVTLESSVVQQPHLLSYFFLGLSYFHLEQYELALNQFQNALDIQPEFERARILVATTLLKQKRAEDAAIEIQKVLRKDPDNAYARNILGSALLASGEYDRGMAELEKAVELDPSLADAHLKRGVFHLSHGAGAEGEADLLKAVEAAPEVLNSRLMLVSLYLRQQNFAGAVDLLTEGLNGSRADALLYNYLAAAYFGQNKEESAVKALVQSKEADPKFLTPYFNLASYYASRSQYDKALAEYHQILGEDENNLKALLGLVAINNVQGNDAEVENLYSRIEATGTEQGFFVAARYRLQKNDPQQALDIAERGLLKFPQSAPLLELTGGIYSQKGQEAEAEAVFQKLAAISPERGYSLLVRLFIGAKQTEKAQSLVQQLLDSNGDSEFPYLLSAGFYVSQKKQTDAESILKKGIQRVNKPLRLEMQLGRLLEGDNRLDEAENIYKGIIAKAPKFAPAHVALGFLKESSGDKAAALELYRSAVKIDPRQVAALNNLAYLLADNFGKMQEALDYALRAYRLEPSDPRVMDTTGYILLQNQRTADAVKLLKKAHEMMPQQSAVALHFGQALIASGDKEQGRSILELVLDSGSSKEKVEAEKLLKGL